MPVGRAPHHLEGDLLLLLLLLVMLVVLELELKRFTTLHTFHVKCTCTVLIVVRAQRTPRTHALRPQDFRESACPYAAEHFERPNKLFNFSSRLLLCMFVSPLSAIAIAARVLLACTRTGCGCGSASSYLVLVHITRRLSGTRARRRTASS